MPPYTAVSHSKRYYIGKDAICQQLLFGFFAVSESFFCLVNQFAQNAVPAEARDAHTAELIMQISGLGVDLDVIRRVTREETGLRLLEKHGLLRADQRGMERILEFTGHLCSLRRALLLDCVRDLIRHFRGGRAGAARVREDVNFREAAGADKAQLVIEGLYKDLERRIESSPPGLCPVDMTRAFLEMCHTHTCGKCVPCRVGLWQLKNLLTDVMNGDATMETLDLMEELSVSIMEGADCAIGYEAAHMVYKSLMGCREDYEEHVRQGRCTCQYTQPVPCVSLCPAHVDIPGYIALVGEGRYADAIRLIRKDNPFPTTCGFICEHPCEARCRRNIVDDAVNIRGLKRMAADYAGKVPPRPCAPCPSWRAW